MILGKTCSASLMSFIEHKLMERGYSVKQNNPFSGGYLTKYYGTQIKKLPIHTNRAFGIKHISIIEYLEMKNFKSKFRIISKK